VFDAFGLPLHPSEQIAEQIKAEIAHQVKDEVSNQIETHLPIPLAIQAAEVRTSARSQLLDNSPDSVSSQSQEQLAEVKVSLQNTSVAFEIHAQSYRDTELFSARPADTTTIWVVLTSTNPSPPCFALTGRQVRSTLLHLGLSSRMSVCILNLILEFFLDAILGSRRD